MLAMASFSVCCLKYFSRKWNN